MPKRAKGKGKGKSNARQPKGGRASPGPARQRRARDGGRGGSAPLSYASTGKVFMRHVTKSRAGSRVVGRELVYESIPGSVAFAVQETMQLNPGLPTSFPLLSVEAAIWEQYTVHSLRVGYESAKSASTNGQYLLALDYDASDPAPSTMTQAFNTFGSEMKKCWEDCVVSLDPASMHAIGPRKFVRSGAVAGDVKTYDVGQVFVCSVNEADTTTIGSVFVEYDIEFFIPQNSPTSGASSASLYIGGAAQTFANNVAEIVDFDTIVADGLGIGAVTGNGLFTPRSGNYLVQYSGTIANSANEATTVVASLFKNGLALTQPILGKSGPTVINAAGSLYVGLLGYVSCNGTDTFAISLTITGATGTLTSVADTNELLITVA